MKSIGQILQDFNPVVDKYISREYQAFGIELAQYFDDYAHRGLYIKLAKNYPRAVLEMALSFVKDSNVDNKAKLFMWKLKQMRENFSPELEANLKSRSKKSIVTTDSVKKKKSKKEQLELF